MSFLDDAKAFFKPKAGFDWMNDERYLAQIAHVLGGYGVVLTAALTHRWAVVVIAAVLLGVYASIKEFVYDANYETPKQTTFDNVLDFTAYMVGMCVGLGVFALLA